MKLLKEEITNLASAKKIAELEDVALKHQQDITSDQRRVEGAIYSPVPIVDRIIDSAIELLPATNEIRILDPACGSGIFLIRLIKKISKIKEFKNKDVKIFAIDKDPAALKICKRLLLETARQIDTEVATRSKIRVATTLIHGNFLIDTEDLNIQQISTQQKTDISPLNWDFDRYGKKEFDLIIGNPPYGLSREDRLTDLENKILQTKFLSSRYGKLNKYMLFMAQAFDLLSPLGLFSFVVPNSWLGIESANRMRSLFIDQGWISKLEHFKIRPFKLASVEVVTVHVKKQPISSPTSIELYTDINQKTPKSSCRINLKKCSALIKGRIPLYWETETSGILEQISRRSFTMAQPISPAFPAIAMQAYAVGKGTPPQTKRAVTEHIFHSSQKIDDSYYPYLEGKNVQRYLITAPAKYLSYGSWLAEPQTLNKFSGPRLLAREILGKAPYLGIFAYTDQTLLYNKSILHILPKSKIKPEFLLILMAILNSALAGYIFFFRGHKSQRKLFPKIVCKDLSDFPIPLATLDDHSQLVALCKKLIDSRTEEKNDLQNQIDHYVLKLYGLSADLLSCLKAFQKYAN